MEEDPNAYLNVFVELVGDVLSWDPAAEVLVLHLLDPLDGVFGNCVERAHYAAVWDSVSLCLRMKYLGSGSYCCGLTANLLAVCKILFKR